MSENIITAIIAGSISLIISGITGIYTIYNNNKRFENLKKELITKSLTEEFIEARTKFLNSFSEFEPKLIRLLKNNPEDGTEALQAIINFFSNNAKDYYLRNKSFLKTNELNSLLEKINNSIDSGTLNNNENQKGRKEFGDDLISFLKKLNDISLKQ